MMKTGPHPRLHGRAASAADACARTHPGGPPRRASSSVAKRARREQQERGMKRKASAVWQGDLQQGKGSISTDSGVLKDTQYSFSTRFADGIGTNPEELIAAAHAGCFSMALSGQLGNAGMTAESIRTTANLSFDKLEAGWTNTAINLDVTAGISGAN